MLRRSTVSLVHGSESNKPTATHRKSYGLCFHQVEQRRKERELKQAEADYADAALAVEDEAWDIDAALAASSSLLRVGRVMWRRVAWVGVMWHDVLWTRPCQ